MDQLQQFYHAPPSPLSMDFVVGEMHVATPWSAADPLQSFGPTTTPPELHYPSTQLTQSPAAAAKDKMKACAGCRIRRVKCTRPPGASDCVQCQKKGLTALFGDAAESEQSTSSLGVMSSQALSRSPSDGLVNNTIVSKLVNRELESALSSSLLDLYFLLPQHRLALLDATSLRQSFEAAGRRVNVMKGDAQTLFSVILAIAARFSDHPLLVGSKAPTLPELDQGSQESVDLTQWGSRREDACTVLMDKAVHLADVNGVWREPSITNIATLLLLEAMKDLRESTHAGHSGRPSTFGDDEFVLLRSDPTETLEAALRSPEVDPNNPQDPYFLPWTRVFFSYLVHLVSLARRCPTAISGIGARYNPYFDTEFGFGMIEQLDAASRATTILEQRSMNYLGEYHHSNDKQKSRWSYVKGMEINRVSLCILLYRAVRDRIQARLSAENHRFQEVGVNDTISQTPEDEEYRRRLETLYVEANARAVQGARELVGMLQMKISLGILTGAGLLFARLALWLPLLVDQPTIEERGQIQDWTYETKISALKTYAAS
ncbi:Zn(2)-C7 fungal-type transcription factor [Pseudohyphozyma bogoriensis]|nr:Zn(2)-C7 fungal-type transcription factor [Pseudohyphozyma bogoriensis]